MARTITSSTSVYYLTANNTSAYVVPGANVGTANGAIYVSGNYDVLTNAGTVHGETAILFGDQPGLGEGDTFINLAAGYVLTNPSVPGTTVLFNIYPGTVINSGRIVSDGHNSAVGLVFGGSVTNFSTGTINGGGLFASEGPATVLNQGLIVGGGTAGFGAVYMGDGGIVTNQSGGTIVSTGSYYGIKITGSDAGTVINGGVINGGSGPAVTFSASTYSDLVVDQTTGVFVGAVTGGGNDSTFELAAGPGQTTLTGFGSSITNFGTLTFDPSANWVVDANSNIAGVTIVGFSPSDTINVAGVTDPSVTQSYSDGITKVTLSGSSPVTLSFAGDLGAFHATTSDGTTELTTLCFGPGTKIDTQDGEVRVEDLVVGDTVRTLGNNGTRTITWIGIGKVLATRGHRSAATPVIVRANALGSGVPHADLRVTKAHGIYLDEVLIPVEFLVNHRTILWDDHAREVTLYHIELDAHDVVFANGAPAESFRDDGNRWLFQNANSGWDLPPQEPFAPVLTGGAVVDAVWRRLLDQSGPCALSPLTRDPDLHLVVDGQRVDTAEEYGRTKVFWLDSCRGGVQIASRDGVPAELGLMRDSRSLGVALAQVVLRRGGLSVTIDAADERLVDGFHGYESAEGLRWTNGLAALPIELFDKFRDGGVEIVLTLAGEAWYPDFGESVAA